MTFAELVTEVKAASLSDRSDAEVKRWINQAIREIENAFRWPWKEKIHTESAPVTLPVTIADLGRVLKVTSGETVIDFLDRRTVLDMDPELSQTGTPSCWFTLDADLYVWPSSTDALTVFYERKAETLSADADVPEIPAEFHELIYTGARIRGFRRMQAYEAARLERDEWDRTMLELQAVYSRRNLDSPDLIRKTGHAGDYV